MTRRRPSNKKPTGLNKSLGNSLANDRERTRKAHVQTKHEDVDFENPAALEKEKIKYIDSITDETSLEEFLAKAILAGTEFTADREQLHVIDNAPVVIPTKLDFKNNAELQREHAYRLKIPRRPSRELWNSADDLFKLENEMFLAWRRDLSELQELDGLTLTPYERNIDMWRELWRVVERSDVVVQIVDARNPLLFYSEDLDKYVKEVDSLKRTLLLVNKADLLEPLHREQWQKYFSDRGIDAVFWSAVDDISLSVIAEESEDAQHIPDIPSTSFCQTREQLTDMLKAVGHASNEIGAKPVVIGMVGYPNVGKSSTINKLAGAKKVSVSATPGKTRHFQTIHLDSQLVLCDCPGLVMPSFAFNRNEMFLNGILPASQMRDHFGPAALVLSKFPQRILEKAYAITLPEEATSAANLLTTIAFMRGFMSASGIPDCSRAGRLLVKDIVNGRLRWIAAPPSTSQAEFDSVSFIDDGTTDRRLGAVQLQQLEKRKLLDGGVAAKRDLDSQFFHEAANKAHLTTISGVVSGTVVPSNRLPADISKKHKKSKEKLRRLYD